MEFAFQSMIFHDLIKGGLWDPTLCCLTITSSACNHSEEGKGNAEGSTGAEFHLHERATSLCSCGTEGRGLEGDLILHSQLDLLILKFFPKLN